MGRAIFLDRDGVICKEKNLFHKGKPITKPEHFEWERGSRGGLQELSGIGDFSLILVTNQASIGRGLLNVRDFHEINKPIYRELEMFGRKLDGVYFCPHIPEENCGCRKPHIGLLLHAKEDLGISLRDSYMVGDKMQDIKTGINAGCKTILVETGYGGLDPFERIMPDFRVKNLLDAARLIKKLK